MVWTSFRSGRVQELLGTCLRTVLWFTCSVIVMNHRRCHLIPIFVILSIPNAVVT